MLGTIDKVHEGLAAGSQQNRKTSSITRMGQGELGAGGMSFGKEEGPSDLELRDAAEAGTKFGAGMSGSALSETHKSMISSALGGGIVEEEDKEELDAATTEKIMAAARAQLEKGGAHTLAAMKRKNSKID